MMMDTRERQPEIRRRAAGHVAVTAFGLGVIGGAAAGMLTWIVWVVGAAIVTQNVDAFGALLLTPFAAIAGLIAGFLLALVWALVLSLYALRSRRDPAGVARGIQFLSLVLMACVVALVNTFTVARWHVPFTEALPWLASADVIALLTADCVGRLVARDYLRAAQSRVEQQ
jgi:hypothetical protein